MPDENRILLPISPRTTFLVVLAMIGVLFVLHLGSMLSSHVLGIEHALGLVPLFDLNLEQNVPTLFSSMLLFSIGGALMLASVRRPFRWRLRLAALTPVAMGISETATLHEPILFILRGGSSPRTEGVRAALGDARWSDVAPYLGGMLLIAFWAYLPLLKDAGKRTCLLALAAAATYLAGAVGFDVWMQRLDDGGGTSTLVWRTLTTMEELLELLGAALMLYAFLDYAARPAVREVEPQRRDVRADPESASRCVECDSVRV